MPDDLEGLKNLLVDQRQFNEEINDHKGDLKFISMTGQKYLDNGKVTIDSNLNLTKLALFIVIIHNVMLNCFHYGIRVYAVWLTWLSLSLLHAAYKERKGYVFA